MKPIKIVGAGPAGLCAAISLAKAGYPVDIFERYDVIGKRFQGDLQGIENWSKRGNVLEELKSFGIAPDFSFTPFTEVTLTDGHRTLYGSSSEPLFYLVKRGPFHDSLDTALGQQALNVGVNIHYQKTESKIEADIIATGPIRQAVIAADKGLVFHTNLPNMAVGIFDDELAYLGYSYLLVAQGYGCLCTVVFKDLHRLNRCFEKTIEIAKRIAPINLTDAKPVGGVGSYILGQPVEEGSLKFVGEAAGFQDFLWGFGIRTALTSGYLAAKSLIHKQSYEKLVKEEINAGLKASLVNRFLWETAKWGKKPILPLLMRFPASLRTHFRLLYSFSPIHRLLYPFAMHYIKKQYPESVKHI